VLQIRRNCNSTTKMKQDGRPTINKPLKKQQTNVHKLNKHSEVAVLWLVQAAAQAIWLATCHRWQEIPATEWIRWYGGLQIDVTFLLPTTPSPVSRGCLWHCICSTSVPLLEVQKKKKTKPSLEIVNNLTNTTVFRSSCFWMYPWLVFIIFRKEIPTVFFSIYEVIYNLIVLR